MNLMAAEVDFRRIALGEIAAGLGGFLVVRGFLGEQDVAEHLLEVRGKAAAVFRGMKQGGDTIRVAIFGVHVVLLSDGRTRAANVDNAEQSTKRCNVFGVKTLPRVASISLRISSLRTPKPRPAMQAIT